MITRMNSGILNLPVKHDSDTEIVTVKDLKSFGERGYVEYSAEEIDVIKETFGEITPTIHRVKKIFDGTIVRGNP